MTSNREYQQPLQEFEMAMGVLGFEINKFCCSLGVLYPRGTTLSGSSQVNAMKFAIPPEDEWRHIAKLTGDESWLPGNIRESFIEMERNRYLAAPAPGHGFDGYISVRF
jgi:hypothetical protein